ncbi:MAG: HD domain-containing protein [Bacilli bacterium]|nr:HD domain-containing protein [Bacilli bacterium]
MIQQLLKYEHNISKFACKDSEAVRLEAEKSDFRSAFFRDIDRIIYSLSYTRYIDKTQVFSNNTNDHLSKRITHVQFVSKIARTIGRTLNLNEDLIEAIGLGHDLGHAPFGHVGESILNEICIKNNLGYFNHNVQSVRILKELENKGKGSNITLQVLDGIMCHNGETLLQKYCPKKKTKFEFLDEYEKCYIDKNTLNNLRSMTLEGCVVRVCDVIGYVGRDLEDGIRLGIISENDIPVSIVNVLGKSNREIINTIVLDVIKNSANKPYIMMSDNVFKAVNELLKFNYENIYYKANTKEQINNYRKMFNHLFNLYLSHIANNDFNQDIYTLFLNDMSIQYLTNNSNKRMVVDYIAGMTDDFFISQYEKYS